MNPTTPQWNSALDPLVDALRALVDGEHNLALAGVIAIVIILFALAIRWEAALTRSGRRLRDGIGFQLDVSPKLSELYKLKREQASAAAVTQALIEQGRVEKDDAPLVEKAIDGAMSRHRKPR